MLMTIMNLWILLCSLSGIVFGIRNVMIPKDALHRQMVTSGIGCLMFSRLFYVVYLFAQGELDGGFNVGMLGIMGSFMFFLAANFSHFDELAGDSLKAAPRASWIAWIAPLIMIFPYAAAFPFIRDSGARISVAVLALLIAFCSYFNLRHVLIFETGSPTLRALRNYNILALIYAFLTVLEFVGYCLAIKALYVSACIGIGLVAAVIIPVLKGGADKWKTSRT